MKIHELKAWPSEFYWLSLGYKRADFRKDDRGFEVGDVLVIRRYTPTREEWKGQFPDDDYDSEDFPKSEAGQTSLDPMRTLMFRVRHVQPGGSFGIPDGYCVLSLSAAIDWKAL